MEIGKRDLQQLIDADSTMLGKISELIARRTTERDAHRKHVETATVNAEAVQTQQQSLLGRMMAFFQKEKSRDADPIQKMCACSCDACVAVDRRSTTEATQASQLHGVFSARGVKPPCRTSRLFWFDECLVCRIPSP